MADVVVNVIMLCHDVHRNFRIHIMLDLPQSKFCVKQIITINEKQENFFRKYSVDLFGKFRYTNIERFALTRCQCVLRCCALFQVVTEIYVLRGSLF